MSLKEQLHSKAASLLRRETITLPVTGLDVQVRGMMFGEKERIAELTGFKQSATMLALCVEDPATGKPLWNPAAREDHDQIAALPIEDSEEIVQAIGRLSTYRAEGNGSSGETTSGPTPSPESSDAPLPLSGSA